MDQRLIRHCKVCGAAYESCYSCERDRSWRVHTDTADHYFMLVVLMDYRIRNDAEKAYASLRARGIDFTATSGYTDSVRALLDEIAARSVKESAVDSPDMQTEDS